MWMLGHIPGGCSRLWNGTLAEALGCLLDFLLMDNFDLLPSFLFVTDVTLGFKRWTT